MYNNISTANNYYLSLALSPGHPINIFCEVGDRQCYTGVRWASNGMSCPIHILYIYIYHPFCNWPYYAGTCIFCHPHHPTLDLYLCLSVFWHQITPTELHGSPYLCGPPHQWGCVCRGSVGAVGSYQGCWIEHTQRSARVQLERLIETVWNRYYNIQYNRIILLYT